MSQLYTLSIETATLKGSLSLFKGERELVSKEWAYEGAHSDELTRFMEVVVQDAGISLFQLGLIAVDWGPGSFTGIRVGINAARSLGYLFHLPMVGLSSLEIMGHSMTQRDQSVVCLIDAQRNALYGASYHWERDRWVENQKPQLLLEEQVKEICGSSSSRIRIADLAIKEMAIVNQLRQEGHEVIGPSPPHSKHLGEIAIRLHQEGRSLVWNDVQPLYIRSSTAEERMGI